ncbi:MAG: hypothetical protein E6X17_16095 [Sporomusaceae bacterium]|nr:hypothetical protein [Sporomusaceae bacterium]
MNKDADKREVREVWLCEARCDSEDTSCPEDCELVTMPVDTVH